jgi:hypothetical protein
MTMPDAPAVPTWVDLLTPARCPDCGQAVMPSPEDYADAFTSSMDAISSSMSRWMGGLGGSIAPASRRGGHQHGRSPQPRFWDVRLPAPGWGWPQPTERHDHHHEHDYHEHDHHEHDHRQHGHHHGRRHHGAGCGCGCHEHGGAGGCGCGCSGKHAGAKHSGGCHTCRTDDCHCRCCIGDDLDIVVYARVGERRILPITITNERRRERAVTLEMGAFTSKGGGAVPVTGSILGEAAFTLAPCEERTVIVEVVSTEAVGDQDQRQTDVDDCLVAVADLRVEGCDIRCPIGIGVALVPRDCDTFDLSCGCGCC